VYTENISDAIKEAPEQCAVEIAVAWVSRDLYYKTKETYHKAKETYCKAKETYHKAKETYKY